MATMIDYISSLIKDPQKSEEFITAINTKEKKELSEWFAQKGITLSPEECQTLIDNKKNIKTTAGAVQPLY